MARRNLRRVYRRRKLGVLKKYKGVIDGVANLTNAFRYGKYLLQENDRRKLPQVWWDQLDNLGNMANAARTFTDLALGEKPSKIGYDVLYNLGDVYPHVASRVRGRYFGQAEPVLEGTGKYKFRKSGVMGKLKRALPYVLGGAVLAAPFIGKDWTEHHVRAPLGPMTSAFEQERFSY